MSADTNKRLAAERALEFVTPGMRLGLGTGSTAEHFVDLVGGLVAGGMDLVCVPTSKATAEQAASLGIKLTTLDETPELDMTVDGADEIGPDLTLIKGGGGALLREKIVANASKRLVIIADGSKLVKMLGTFPLPIEIVPFGAVATKIALRKATSLLDLSGDIIQRMSKDGTPFITDNGNLIFDCHFSAIPEPARLVESFSKVPGIVEHGLFIEMTTVAIIAGENGVEALHRG